VAQIASLGRYFHRLSWSWFDDDGRQQHNP
jgi:hypothetical protein